MGVYDVNLSTNDGPPEDISQNGTVNPYSIFLRIKVVQSLDYENPEVSFKKIQEVRGITDKSFMPYFQSIIRCLKVCLTQSPNILAFSKALTESPYSRSFQEILESKLIKNNLDCIKNKTNNSLVQEESKKDFLKFFQENYLCYDDKKREDLFCEEIIDYNNFSESQYFVQWGTHADLESAQESTSSPTLSAGASSSSVPPPAPPPPPPPSAPPPTPTSNSDPLPTIDRRAFFNQIITYKHKSKNSQTNEDVGLSGFLKPPELSLNLSKIFNDHSDLAHFVESINEHINKCFPETHQDFWKVCLENYMDQGVIADNKESRDAFRYIVTIGQLDITEQKNIKYLPKEFFSLIKQYLNQSVFSESELSTWDNFTSTFFNDPKSLDKQRQEWENSKKNFENSLGIDEKKQNVSRLKEEIQNELNQEKEIDKSLKMFGRKLFSKGTEYREKRNKLNRVIAYFKKYPRTEATTLGIAKDVEQKFEQGVLDSYFMSNDERTEFAEYVKNQKKNSSTISKKEKELEDEKKRIEYILLNTKAISDFFEFMKHVSSFYEKQKQTIENLLPEGQISEINAKEIKNPKATFESVKNKIDFNFVLYLLAESNKKYCQKTEKLIIDHFCRTTKDLNSIIAIAKKYLRINEKLTAPQCIKNLYDSQWDLRMMLIKKIYGKIALEDCYTAIGLIYKDDGVISRPKALHYLIHHNDLIQQKNTDSPFIKKLELNTMTLDEIYEFAALSKNSSLNPKESLDCLVPLSPKESLDYLLKDSSKLPYKNKNDFIEKIFEGFPKNEKNTCIVSYYESIFIRKKEGIEKEKNNIASLEKKTNEKEKKDLQLLDEISRTRKLVRELQEDSNTYQEMVQKLQACFEKQDIQEAVKFLYGSPNLLGGETTYFFCKFLLDEIPELLKFIKRIPDESKQPIEIIKKLNEKFKIKDNSVEIKIIKEILKKSLKEEELFLLLLRKLNTSIAQQNKSFVELCAEFLKNPHFEITTKDKNLIENITQNQSNKKDNSLSNTAIGQPNSGKNNAVVTAVSDNKPNTLDAVLLGGSGWGLSNTRRKK